METVTTGSLLALSDCSVQRRFRQSGLSCLLVWYLVDELVCAQRSTERRRPSSKKILEGERERVETFRGAQSPRRGA